MSSGSVTGRAETRAPSSLRVAVQNTGLASRFADYAPDFRIEEFAPEKWWIFDRDVKVGLVIREYQLAELVNHDPHHPDRSITFPRIYHAPTMTGDRVTFAMYGLSSDRTENDLRFAADRAAVTATFTEHWPDGRTAVHTLTWKVDPDFGYILCCTAEMHSPTPDSREYCNFLPQGTTDDRPEFARYPYILWQHPSGETIRWNQNCISAVVAGMVNAAQRSIMNGGFIGYFGEPNRNATLEMLESTPTTMAVTCLNMLDEHIIWRPTPASEFARDAEGRYVSRAVYNIVSVPGTVGTALTGRARMADLMLDKSTKEIHYRSMVFGKEADFEAPMDLAATFRGIAFSCGVDEPGAPVTVAADVGHSGTHSLRLRADGQLVASHFTGGSLHVTEGQRYRVSAWIKTDLTDGQAVLKVDECIFTFDNVTAQCASDPLTGRTDWRRVFVEFTPGEKAHVITLRAEVSGHGTAWVDDILMEKL